MDGSITIHPKEIVVKGRGRREFKDLDVLRDSIANVGLLHPIVVVKEGEKYLLVAGERRLRAMGLLAWDKIPCTVTTLGELKRKEAELEENLSRSDITWVEQVEMLRTIDEIKRRQYGSKMKGGGGGDGVEGWDNKQTAALAGMSEKSVQAKVKFAKELKDRPDLRERVKDLPMIVAKRLVRKIKEGEKLARLEAQGLVKLSTELRLGDCRGLLKELESNSVDLVLTDPPFGMSMIDDSQEGVGGNSQTFLQVAKETDNMGYEDAMGLLGEVIPELYRVLKPSGHLYMFFAFEGYEYLRVCLGKAGFVVNCVPIVWDKERMTAPFKGYEYAPCYEPVWFAHKPPRSKRLNGPEKLIVTYKRDQSKDKIHPFQKPQELLRTFIRMSSKVGDLILDPFAGSGSTLVAARSLKRKCLGFEVDEEHFRIAQSRLLGEKGDGR